MGKIKWNPNGLSFAAVDKAQLVFVYPQQTLDSARDVEDME